MSENTADIGGMKERRGFARVASQFNVRIARQGTERDGKDMAVNVARSINISASGILLELNDVLNTQDVFRLIFVKPNSFELFEGSARVVRSERNSDRTWSAAMVFLNLSESEKNSLDYQIRMTV